MGTNFATPGSEMLLVMSVEYNSNNIINIICEINLQCNALLMQLWIIYKIMILNSFKYDDFHREFLNEGINIHSLTVTASKYISLKRKLWLCLVNLLN